MLVFCQQKKCDSEDPINKLKKDGKFKMEGSGSKLLFNSYQLKANFIKIESYSVSTEIANSRKGYNIYIFGARSWSLYIN